MSKCLKVEFICKNILTATRNFNNCVKQYRGTNRQQMSTARSLATPEQKVSEAQQSIKEQ